MSAAVDVKTLIIDGQEVSARDGQTILEVAREHNINIPTLCHLEGLSDVGACRLCLVEIKGTNKLLPACVTTVQEGMEVTTSTERLQKHRRDHSRTALCRAQPHLLGLRRQRPLRTADPRPGAGADARPPALSQPRSCRRCLARALHPRSQPLHPLHALRPRLRRNRRRAHLGRHGPRHRFVDHLRPAPGVGQFRAAPAAASACRSAPPGLSSTRAKSVPTTPSIPIFCLI